MGRSIAAMCGGFSRRSRSLVLFLVATLALTACDSWAESARRAEEAGLDAAFSTTTVSIVDDGGPIAPEEPTTSTTTAATTTIPAGPTTTAAPSTTATPSTLAPARTVPAVATTTPPSPTTTASPTTTTIPVVALPPSTTAAPVNSVGWVAILASLSTSNYTRAEAAAWRLQLGIESAEILLSNDYTSLTPGYWVLYRGPYPDHSTAVDVCATFAATVPACYPRQLTLGS